MALKKGKPLHDWTKAAPGRPKSNLGSYLIKPIGPDRSKTGFEMLEKTPAAVKAAKEKYLQKYELPPTLQPQYLREPEVQARQRGKQISKGWVKPRSVQG